MTEFLSINWPLLVILLDKLEYMNLLSTNLGTPMNRLSYFQNFFTCSILIYECILPMQCMDVMYLSGLYEIQRGKRVKEFAINGGYG